MTDDAKPNQSADPGRVLIVRPSALGDVARSVPALVSLRQRLPHAHIDWLINAGYADVVQHHPMLDGVILFDRDALHLAGLRPSATRAALGLRKQLRHADYDVVYDIQGLFRSGLLTWLTRAPRRVGYANAREWGFLGYTVRHDISDRIHAVDRMLGLLKADGLATTDDMRLYLGEADRQWLDSYLADHSLAPRRYACIAPTARWLSKCWPIDRYADIARRLLDTGVAGEHLIVLAAPSERDQVQPLLDALPPAMRERVLLPTTRVGQLMALLSETSLLVCNDSAALHIAVGFDRPTVAIFGPTDPALVGPYRRDDDVVRPAVNVGVHDYRDANDQTLVAKVSVDEVWSRIKCRSQN
ncbi:glycosyltransferase family 9 protein [Phycisphaerales bacterium AB-hyl4]|uniref:Glycosyltransferase family 9 protein n=1 Tax=Natronomicrosphaera hydrolytica TaxID=3242702 RepID=A0ABV4U1X6_9BACT